MSYVEIPIFATLLTEKDKKVDLYILISGKLHVKNNKREEYVVDSFQMLGYTKLLNQQSWVPARVSAREPTMAIVVKRADFKQLMDKVNKTFEKNFQLEFITKTIPGVTQLARNSKQKLLSYFEVVNFKNGDIILREGQMADYGYIIVEGDCKRVSHVNPTKRPMSAPARGLMSKTTSCYNYGIVSTGEWIGDDSILKGSTMIFSVIACSNVKGLRISKQDFIDHMPRDSANKLKDRVEAKLQWLESRRQTINSTIKETVCETQEDSVEKTLKHTENSYPVANINAVLNIWRLELAKSDYNPKVMTATPNARIHTRNKSVTKEEKRSNTAILLSPSQKPNKSSPISPRTQASEVSFFKINSTSTRLCRSAFKSRPNSSYAKTTRTAMKPLFSPTCSSPTLNLYRSYAPDREDDDKTILHSAATLGCSLVPTIPLVKPKISYIPASPINIPRVVRAKDRFGYTVKQEDDSNQTYAQKVRKRRPESPNPVEQWARKYNINVSKLGRATS